MWTKKNKLFYPNQNMWCILIILLHKIIIFVNEKKKSFNLNQGLIWSFIYLFHSSCPSILGDSHTCKTLQCWSRYPRFYIFQETAGIHWCLYKRTIHHCDNCTQICLTASKKNELKYFFAYQTKTVIDFAIILNYKSN